MEIKQIVIVDNSQSVPIIQLEELAAALQIQISEHFAPVWGVDAVIRIGSEAELTANDWPIYLVKKIDVKGVRGYHWVMDGLAGKIPYAKVELTNTWTAVVSHELVEMLVNPFVDRFVATEIYNETSGDESFFLEVAGPSQSLAFSYQIGAITVSNFFYPAYFDLIAVAGKQYDYLGVITEPRSILEGGYVSFLDNAKQWWQGFNAQGKVFYKKLKSDQAFTLQEINQVQRAIFISLGGVALALVLYFLGRFIIRQSKK